MDDPTAFDRRGVPARYRGIWRRTLLASSAGHDTSTTVFWLQGARWHADLRIPADRPDFAGVAGLSACTPAQRAWLATQQGFAGITSVRRERAANGTELCSWRRLFDLQPPASRPDEGFMHFDGDLLVETGVHDDYLEHWQRLPQAAAHMAVLGLLDGAGERAVMDAKQMLFLAGPYVMHLAWPRTADGAVQRVDAEISFGTRSARGYTILRSTQPWLEGRRRTVRLATAPGATVNLECDGHLQKWNVLETAGPGCWDGWA